MRFAGFLQFSHGFLFLSTMMAIFRIFLANAFCGFSGFAKDVTRTRASAKTVIPRDHLKLEECMTSLVSLAKNLKITSKQFHTAGILSCVL